MNDENPRGTFTSVVAVIVSLAGTATIIGGVFFRREGSDEELCIERGEFPTLDDARDHCRTTAEMMGQGTGNPVEHVEGPGTGLDFSAIDPAIWLAVGAGLIALIAVYGVMNSRSPAPT